MHSLSTQRLRYQSACTALVHNDSDISPHAQPRCSPSHAGSLRSSRALFRRADEGSVAALDPLPRVPAIFYVHVPADYTGDASS